MNEIINNYISEVIKHMVVDERTKTRIKNDLYHHISQAAEASPIEEVIGRMGEPSEVANEFMDSLYESKDEIISKLIAEKVKMENILNSSEFYEYKSKLKIMGLPLLHIKFRRKYGYRSFGFRKPAMAKGIIAIGETAAGLVAIGIFPVGGLCIGAIPFGLIALGGFSIGALALGGLAIGLMAVGGIAIGLGALGGLAIGKIAIGGYAKGFVAIGGKAVGKYIINTQAPGSGNGSYSLGYVTKDQIEALIRKGYPDMANWIVKIFRIIGAK